MKKTIIISTIALCFSMTTINAEPVTNSVKDYTTVAVFKVSPFCVSIAKGDFETVKRLIELGVDINEKSNGMTPVMYAAKFNRTDILEYLIKKGADLKEKSDRGLTAIKYAKMHGANDAQLILKKAMS